MAIGVLTLRYNFNLLVILQPLDNFIIVLKTRFYTRMYVTLDKPHGITHYTKEVVFKIKNKVKFNNFDLLSFRSPDRHVLVTPSNIKS